MRCGCLVLMLMGKALLKTSKLPRAVHAFPIINTKQPREGSGDEKNFLHYNYTCRSVTRVPPKPTLPREIAIA